MSEVQQLKNQYFETKELIEKIKDEQLFPLESRLRSISEDIAEKGTGLLPGAVIIDDRNKTYQINRIYAEPAGDAPDSKFNIRVVGQPLRADGSNSSKGPHAIWTKWRPYKGG